MGLHHDDSLVSVSGEVMSRGVRSTGAYDAGKVRAQTSQLFADGASNFKGNSGLGNCCRFESYVTPGDRVVIKPNWVTHANQARQGLDCLVTHASVLEAAMDLVLSTRPSSLIVGDAPVQGCDLRRLMESAGYNRLKERYSSSEPIVSWRDFRRSTLSNVDGIWDRQENVRPLTDYVLFDLGEESLLEPISRDSEKFRVTMYNPDLMRETHAPGRHQYLIAREVIEASVILNLPKLKTHKKACLTGALKNLVGVNGNKDYLPHHRRGGSKTGGDCYEGGSRFKLAAECLGDAANRRGGMIAHLLRQTARGCYGVARLAGGDRNLEGSWYGNDTVWRMCLDLNRIVRYGKADGTMADQPQRSILTLTDAIIGGEAEGPLAPTPHPLGLLTFAVNPVAADYVHAHLMGLEWRSVPIVREAFGSFRYPLCSFKPEEVRVQFNRELFGQPWPLWNPTPFILPTGWQGRCERK
jgi:uncharacterized protein (DUF362 family)